MRASTRRTRGSGGGRDTGLRDRPPGLRRRARAARRVKPNRDQRAGRGGAGGLAGRRPAARGPRADPRCGRADPAVRRPHAAAGLAVARSLAQAGEPAADRRFQDPRRGDGDLPARPEQRAAGVLAHSSGNHAQAVAYTARAFGIDAHIVIPDNAADRKIQRHPGPGRHRRTGPGRSSASAGPLELAEQTGKRLIPPFDHPDVISGQGTVGLEIAQDMPDVDIVLVPVSGGGLISGVAAAMTALLPDAAGDRGRTRTRRRRGRVLRGRTPGRLAAGADRPHHGRRPADLQRRRAAVAAHPAARCTTSSPSPRMRSPTPPGVSLLEARLVAEPSGAVAAAAFLHHRDELPAGATVAVVSGGNMDPAVLRATAGDPDRAPFRHADHADAGRRGRSGTCFGRRSTPSRSAPAGSTWPLDQAGHRGAGGWPAREDRAGDHRRPRPPGRRPGGPTAERTAATCSWSAGPHRPRPGRRGGPNRRRSDGRRQSASAGAATPRFPCCSPRWPRGCTCWSAPRTRRSRPPPTDLRGDPRGRGRDDAALVARASGLARIAGRPPLAGTAALEAWRRLSD